MQPPFYAGRIAATRRGGSEEDERRGGDRAARERKGGKSGPRNEEAALPLKVKRNSRKCLARKKECLLPFCL